MKIARVLGVLGGLVSLGMVAALVAPLAQAKSQAAPSSQAIAKEKEMPERLQAAVDDLNLTDDQKAKVKVIFADAKTKREALINDASLSEEQKKTKMKEIRASTRAKVDEVLTPDQRTELKSKMEAEKTKPSPQP